jgi:predicted outer membrane protein
MSKKLHAALAALFLIGVSGTAMAADKPTDPQIAHIAYTAGEIDIKAANLAVKKSKNKESWRSPRTCCATMRRSTSRRLPCSRS